jgi:hypothetical protein
VLAVRERDLHLQTVTVSLRVLLVVGMDIIVTAVDPGVVAVGDKAGPAEAYDVMIDVV